ncbi:hypothetical protein Acr_20g0004600 [Actinidia rufa]|uniref:Uncharacterized protein n=1 Tax=Actinidia rufa TaxID=165716 RepID=A0A7J0GD39_9ERIC|nr:hypothetical protein Acr_20g0004600 [Actinidia rufa]
MKLATKSIFRSPNESMVLEDNFLNHDLVGPFKLAEKDLHIALSEYPWSNIKFLYESKWSMRSIFLSYTLNWDDNLNLDDTLTFITLSVNGGLVYLIKASTMTRAFGPVLMASIRVSRWMKESRVRRSRRNLWSAKFGRRSRVYRRRIMRMPYGGGTANVGVWKETESHVDLIHEGPERLLTLPIGEVMVRDDQINRGA